MGKANLPHLRGTRNVFFCGFPQLQTVVKPHNFRLVVIQINFFSGRFSVFGDNRVRTQSLFSTENRSR